MSAAEVHELPVPDQQAVERFLRSTLVDHIHIVVIPVEDHAKPYGRDFDDDAAAAAAWAVAENRKGHGVYWTVNIVKPNVNKKPKKEDMAGARFLHVDVDPPKDGSRWDRDGAITALRSFEPPAAFIINSGGGLGGFWRLDGIACNLPAVEDLNRRISNVFGGDNCHNIDRLMRLPGTVNYPNEVKRRRGRIPALASILVEDSGEFVEPEEMHSVLPALPPEQRADRARVHLEGVTLLSVEQLGLIPFDPLVEIIENRDVNRRSERTLSCAATMVRRGFENHEIAGILLNPALGVSAHCLDQPDPIRAARRAIGRARGDYEAQYMEASNDDGGGDAPPPSKPPSGGNPTGEPPASGGSKSYEVSEDFIALAFTKEHGGDLLFDHHVGKWFRWTGVFWEQDETDLALDYARKLARKLGDGKRALGKAATASGVEKLCRADRVHAVTSATWDRDPLLLGTPIGTINLENGELSDPNREDRITRQTGVAPAHGSPELWLRFLHEALDGDQELIDFLQLWCGYCLTGLTIAHALLFIFGPGGNGKSVFLNTLVNIMGSYASVAAMETFTASRSERHSTELAMLRGARLVTASETEEGRAWAESRIKALTGGDPVTARFMRQDFFTFRPNFKLTIAGNHAPSLRSVDDAMKRRFNIAPFIIKPARPDPMLERKLREEYPQILAWMIAGARRFLASGLTRPDAVQAATEEYFSEQDVFGQWFEERCVETPGRWDLVKNFYSNWSAFAKSHGEEPGSQKSFGAAMRRKGYQSKSMRSGGVPGKVYQGIALQIQEDGDDYGR